jgi:hypothetical protein
VPLSRLAPLVALVAAACTSTSRDCPGTSQGTFQVNATLASAACASEPAGFSYGNLVPSSLLPTVTLTFSDFGAGAALCQGRAGADPLIGTYAGNTISVSVVTTQAALGGCDPACLVSIRQEVDAQVVRGGAGAAIGLTGTLTDTAIADASASCGACVTPCVASYTLALVH